MTAHPDDLTVAEQRRINDLRTLIQVRQQRRRESRASWLGWAIVVMVAIYLVTALAAIVRVVGWGLGWMQ